MRTSVAGWMLGAAVAGQALAWTSPGTGLVLDPEDLVALSGGALTGGGSQFTQSQALVISAGDQLVLPAGTDWTVAASVELRVHGRLTALGTPWEPIVLRADSGQPNSWTGLILDTAEDASHLRCVTVSGGDDGLNCLASSPTVEYCVFRGNFSSGINCFLGSSPRLTGCRIEDNQRYGVEITGGCSPVFDHCVFRGNNVEAATPRNAVSIGIQGSNNPLFRACRLEGRGPANPASGFSHWMAGNPQALDCEITGFRSGVVIQGAGALGALERCWIHSNRYSNPIQGGSGINVNTSAAPRFRGCVIEDNDWGVTITSACAPDFGGAEDLGGNRLHDNGNGGNVWDFYHNTSGALQARGNWWGSTDPSVVELHIHDSADGAFGDVVTDPLRADSLLAPVLSPDTGWAALLEGETLALRPADRFRAAPGTVFTLEGPGSVLAQGDSLWWTPPAGADTLFQLVLRATPQGAPSATDTLTVWLRRAAAPAPQLAIRAAGPDILLEWSAVPGALAYRLERSPDAPLGGPETETVYQGSLREFREENGLARGRACYRVVAIW